MNATEIAKIAAVVAQILAKQGGKPAKAAKSKTTTKVEAKAQRPTKEQMKVQMDLLTKAAFEAKGFNDVQPRINVLTAKRWAEQNRVVKPGSEPVWVKAPWMTAKQMGYPMFHVSQLV